MDWLKALQATPGQNLQDALWSIATPGFWMTMSVISGIGGLAVFIWLMREVERRRHVGLRGIDAVMVGRMGWMGAMILGSGVRWNSGLIIASFGVFVLAGAYMGLLSATNWCARSGSFAYKIGQILGEVAAYIRRPESTTVKHR